MFGPSFDWKKCNDAHLIEQKLNYIPENTSKGEDRLVESPSDYEHSSARFYNAGETGAIQILTYLELQDVDLTGIIATQSP